jgi:hypothetical protein
MAALQFGLFKWRKRKSLRSRTGRRFPMKRLMISAFAAIALLAAATTMLRSHTPSADRPVAAAGMMTLQGLGTPDVNKLPIEDFEDQSLVFSKTTR